MDRRVKPGGDEGGGATIEVKSRKERSEAQNRQKHSFVIAGLDPAIHTALPFLQRLRSARGSSPWTTGSSPGGDEKKSSADIQFVIAGPPRTGAIYCLILRSSRSGRLEGC
jgi:hypothetical protein